MLLTNPFKQRAPQQAGAPEMPFDDDGDPDLDRAMRDNMGGEDEAPDEDADVPEEDAVPVEEEVPAEAEEPVIDENVARNAEKAKVHDNILEAMTRDPVGVIKKLLETSPGDTTAKLLASLGITPTEEIDPSDAFETVSDVEKLLMDERKEIKKKIADIPKQVEAGFSEVAHHINRAHLTNLANQARMDAIATALGVDVPRADGDRLWQEFLNTGDFGKAIDNVYTPVLAKVATAVKQAAKPRPATVKSTTGRAIDRSQKKSFVDYFNET